MSLKILWDCPFKAVAIVLSDLALLLLSSLTIWYWPWPWPLRLSSANLTSLTMLSLTAWCWPHAVQIICCWSPCPLWQPVHRWSLLSRQPTDNHALQYSLLMVLTSLSADYKGLSCILLMTFPSACFKLWPSRLLKTFHTAYGWSWPSKQPADDHYLPFSLLTILTFQAVC